MHKLAAIGLAFGFLTYAADPQAQAVRTVKTERLDLPSGGSLRITKLAGDVSVEGWDRPEVEVTTTRSTAGSYSAAERDKIAAQLDAIRITVGRQGNDVVIGGDPKGLRSLSLWSRSGFYFHYRIYAPRAARLVVEHLSGELHVDNLTGDIDANLSQGEIALRLPEDKYAIQAKSRIGGITSDFAGKQDRIWPFGHRFASSEPQAAHELNLEVGFGDIILLKSSDLQMAAQLAR